MADSQGRKRHLVRYCVVAGCFFLMFLSFVVSMSLLIRARAQRLHIAAVLRFHAAVVAQYGRYEYEPPPTSHVSYGSGAFEMVHGRGQRVMGYSIIDEPSTLLEVVVPMVGADGIAEVTKIQISDKGFGDTDIDLLLAFPRIREIDLCNTAITGVGLRKILTLRQLTVLNISGTDVSDKSLEMLGERPELKELDIHGLHASRETLALLRRNLPQCWIRE